MDCPNTKLILEIVDDARDRHFSIPARCKSWGCEVCGPLNSRNLGRLLGSALDGYLEDHGLTSSKVRYTAKLVTLTCPGREWRGSRTLQEAYSDFSKALTSLLEYLRRHWSLEEYFKVIEFQDDGMPHAHVLILGTCISSKGIMRAINDAWECRGMGRAETKLVRSIKGASHYLTKYLSKSSQKNFFKKGARCWSMSARLRSRVKEQKEIYSINYTVVAVYKKNSDGSKGSLLWDITSVVGLDPALRIANEEKMIPHFKGKIIPKGVQAYIWTDL